MRQQSEKLFWISYADLMTALFIVSLALFVFAYKMFKVKQDNLELTETELRVRSLELDKQDRALEDLKRRLSEEEMSASALIEELNDERSRLLVMEEEYKKLKEIEEAIKRLEGKYFVYQPEYKRHVLRSRVQFPKGKSTITENYHDMLLNAGKALEALVASLEKDDNIKYLLVIEGMASKDAYTRNYELSYERALALSRLWERQGVGFDSDRCEVIISGSGTGGVGREMDDESKNQQFLIQIIPKIGELKTIDFREDLENDGEIEDENEKEAEGDGFENI